jgi:hypothetical protein
VELPIEQLVQNVFPGARVGAATPLGADAAGTSSSKQAGYGVPIRIDVTLPDGTAKTLVLHTERPNEYGHDRRADRAGDLLLAFDTFGQIPRHVPALDVGTVLPGGQLLSVREGGEFYLLTAWGEGAPYANDLRRIARASHATAEDRARCEGLAAYLAGLHAERGGPAGAYLRAVRDLVGHGEGIFGLLDAYPPEVPGAPAARLNAIERRCVEWRWRLRDRASRLTRTHGDFHPFNVLFDDRSELVVLDASRGGRGDPADDVVCMAINYVFFALGAPGSWQGGFGALWELFWSRYLDATGDTGVLEVAAPFLAWRALVLSSPRWYPEFDAGARDRLLGLVERTLDAPRFDPRWAAELFS